MKLWNWDSASFNAVDVEERLVALAASAAAYAVETEEGPAPQTLDDLKRGDALNVSEGSPFVIPLLIPEEMESGDGRKMEKDALTTRDLPIPLLWQPQTGDGHNGSFIVGRIDTIERVENGLGNARGVFDTGPYGREAERLVDKKMLRGVSADLDQFEATVDGQEMSGDNFQEEVERITSDKITVNKARVMAATLVSKPAFQECTIELVSESPVEEDFAVADGIIEETPSTEDAADYALSALAASAAPVNPPQTWFDNPELDRATPLAVDDDGRVYGHIATWDTDHIGYNYGVKPPRSRSNYAYFRTGLVRTQEGEDVAVGQLTLAGGHAPLDVDAPRAVKHYDETNSAVADVACGEDAFGIWVAGGLRPGVTPENVRVLRASAPSGDWRPVNGALELVAVCQVNVPGFPIARARVASGHVMALVAAGASTLHKIKRSEVDELATRVSLLETQLLEQKRAELAIKMAPAQAARIDRLREAAENARAILAPELDKRAQLAARAEELRAQFKMYVPDPDFKEELHPRNDEGKFRRVLGRLDQLLGGEGASNPEATAARDQLEQAADLEDSGDAEGARAAAGDAAQKIESAAESAGASPGAEGETPVDGEGQPKAHLGDQLHEIATDIAGAIADGAETIAEGDDGEVPEEFKALLDKIVDEIGEGVDPQTIVSRMDNKLRHWLEGKGFQNPEDLIKIVEKLLQRPIQPGITQ